MRVEDSEAVVKVRDRRVGDGWIGRKAWGGSFMAEREPGTRDGDGHARRAREAPVESRGHGGGLRHLEGGNGGHLGGMVLRG